MADGHRDPANLPEREFQRNSAPASNGNRSERDSREWSNIEPVIQERAKVRTVVYDRAGLGKSDPNPRPYRIEDEGTALRRALDQCNIHGPIILVAHSYGGFISEIVASEDKRVKGLVLVDANIPSFLDDKEAAVIAARYEPLAEALEKDKPDAARVLIPLVQAYPATARHMPTYIYR